MSTTLINFVHANGFPAASYQTFFHYFSKDYRLTANPQYGHNPKYPLDNNWKNLVQELIDYIRQQGEPVVCLGHSFGGVLSYMAACQQPQLFKGLIMLDPPVMTGPLAKLMGLLKHTPLIDKVTPAGKAEIRRNNWPAGSNMVNQFANRKLFRHFDKRCLEDYARHCVTERNQRLELNFSPEIEAGIFRSLPTDLSRYKNKLTVPAALIYGEKSDLYPHYIFKRFARTNNIQIKRIAKAGHMFPLERPEESARLIESLIRGWQ